MSQVIAVAVTLVAAFLFGLSSVLEQRSTKLVPDRGSFSPRLLADLARQRRWLVALGIQIAGNILQVAALHFGALALVQPLLVADLLFAVGIAAALRRRHHRPDRIMVAGVLCAAAGIASFLAVGRPGGGKGVVGLDAVLPLVTSLAAVLAVCLAAARWGSRRLRPLWLAIACGADFGVTAFLLKITPDTLAQGFGDPLRQWPLYLLIVVGPLGFLLNQSAFQAGLLIAPVLAIITALDPLISIGIARVWLDESFASSPPALAGEALSLAVMTGGIVALAHRAPQVARNEVKAGQADAARKEDRNTIC
ncbi:MAG TPA: DMT family transporter [Streptosporangiaceae bacterium]|nr:DMT family transporter [Streptosporangiaceae bacterium]